MILYNGMRVTSLSLSHSSLFRLTPTRRVEFCDSSPVEPHPTLSRHGSGSWAPSARAEIYPAGSTLHPASQHCISSMLVYVLPGQIGLWSFVCEDGETVRNKLGMCICVKRGIWGKCLGLCTRTHRITFSCQVTADHWIHSFPGQFGHVTWQHQFISTNLLFLSV